MTMSLEISTLKPNQGKYSEIGFKEGCDENNKKKTQIPNPDSILFKPTAPTIQHNRVYGYKELKIQLQCQSSNPPKDRIKRGKKTLQFGMITSNHNQTSKKTKLFEKTQIKNLEDPHYTILQIF